LGEGGKDRKSVDGTEWDRMGFSGPSKGVNPKDGKNDKGVGQKKYIRRKSKMRKRYRPGHKKKTKGGN